MEKQNFAADRERIVPLSRRLLGVPGTAELTLDPILKGGSDRHFYRLKTGGEATWIVVKYGSERAENELYAGIARFLEELGVPVPRVVAEDKNERILWLEDLGQKDLHFHRAEPWDRRLNLYGEAIGAVSILHSADPDRARGSGLNLMPGFDEKLYAWERNYFYDELLAGVCDDPLAPGNRAEIETELMPVAAALAGKGQGLVHRDFQSQNIMVRGEEVYLIDFQGMRPGVRHYDLASLIFDPYVVLNAAEREELIGLAFLLDGGGQGKDEFRRDLLAAAMQRLMQALGAYGLLGLKKEKTEFLGYIPHALENLRWVLQQGGFSPVLSDLVEKHLPGCRVKYATSKSTA